MLSNISPFPFGETVIAKAEFDHWYYGILLTNGSVLAVTDILGTFIQSGEEWWEVSLLEDDKASLSSSMPGPWKTHISSPTSRPKMSVRVSEIVGVVELADT